MIKLGTHGLGRGPSQFLIDAGMRGGKWVNSDPPTNLPTGFLAIWRWVELPDNVNDQMGNGDPEGSARAWVALQWPHIQFVPQTAFIEGPNENNCENPEQAAWFSRFEIERMRLMEARGYRCVIGCFGTGRPSRPVSDVGGTAIWTALLPMLRYARTNGHLLGMHAYEYNPHDIYNMLRHRAVYAWLPIDAQPRLVITEWGLDGALGRFRDSRWREQYADPDLAYFDIMREYDVEVQADPYLLLFTVFTEGTNNSVAWAPFDIAGTRVMQYLIDYFNAEGNMADPNGTVYPPAGKEFGWLYAERHLAVNIYDQPNGSQKYNILGEWQNFFNILAAWWDGMRWHYRIGDTSVQGNVFQAAGWARCDAPNLVLVDNRVVAPNIHVGVPPCAIAPGQIPFGLDDRVQTANAQMVNVRSDVMGNILTTLNLNERGICLREYPRYQPDVSTGLWYEVLFDVGVRGWVSADFLAPVDVIPPPPAPPSPGNYGLVANGGFENTNWVTRSDGNQEPVSWTLVLTPSGAAMYFPTKMQEGNIVPAIAGGPAEAVHKFAAQLGLGEQLNGSRALILDGQLVYKMFAAIAFSAELRQVIRGTPGRTVEALAYICGESPDRPTPPNDSLEDDHFRAELSLGGIRDSRRYAEMVQTHDVSTSSRPWNLFVARQVIPANGELLLQIAVQKNWSGQTDFFVDLVTARYVDAPPPPPGEIDVAAIRVLLASIQAGRQAIQDNAAMIDANVAAIDRLLP